MRAGTTILPPVCRGKHMTRFMGVSQILWITSKITSEASLVSNIIHKFQTCTEVRIFISVTENDVLSLFSWSKCKLQTWTAQSCAVLPSCIVFKILIFAWSSVSEIAEFVSRETLMKLLLLTTAKCFICSSLNGSCLSEKGSRLYGWLNYSKPYLSQNLVGVKFFYLGQFRFKISANIIGTSLPSLGMFLTFSR